VKSNPKAFWSYVKHKTGRSAVSETIFKEREVLTSADDKADAFNKYFYSVFNNSSIGDKYPNCVASNSLDICNINFSEEDICSILKNIDQC
jgi:hypothetical protein